MASVSNGLSREVASEFSSNHAPVSMSTGSLSPITLVSFGLPPGVTVSFLALHTQAHLLPRYSSVSSQAWTPSILRRAVCSLWIQRPRLQPAKMALDHRLPDMFVVAEVLFLAGSTGSRTAERMTSLLENLKSVGYSLEKEIYSVMPQWYDRKGQHGYTQLTCIARSGRYKSWLKFTSWVL